MTTIADIPVHCRHDAIEETDRVKPNPENPNEHPQAQLKKLVDVITRNGWRMPITVSSRSGMVTKGHGRLLAAKLAGWSHVPIEHQRYRSANEEWADVIADNQLSELGETDEALVAQALEKLRASEPGHLGAAGYDENEFTGLLARLRGDPVAAAKRGTDAPPGPQAENRRTITLHFSAEEHGEFENLVGQAMKDFDLLTVTDTLRRVVEEELQR
jgi:ParB-like chromosome segregation protein Spo0J